MSFFGKNIRKIRVAKKMTQTEFAKLFDLKRTALGAYEEGRAEAKPDTLIKIADYFKISLDVLLRKEITVNEIFHFPDINQSSSVALLTGNSVFEYFNSPNNFDLLSVLNRLPGKFLPDSIVVGIEIPFDCKTSYTTIKALDVLFLTSYKGQGKLLVALYKSQICIVENTGTEYIIHTQSNTYSKNDLSNLINIHQIVKLHITTE